MAIAEFRSISGGIELGTAGFSLPGDNAGFCRSILSKNASPAPLRLESLTYILPSEKAEETQGTQQPPTVVNLLMQLRAYYDQSNTFLRSHTALEVQLTSQLRQVLARSNGAVRAQARELERAIRGSLLKEGELRRSLEQLEREVKKNENDPLNGRSGSRAGARTESAAPARSVLTAPLSRVTANLLFAERGGAAASPAAVVRPSGERLSGAWLSGERPSGAPDASGGAFGLPPLQERSGASPSALQQNAAEKLPEQDKAGRRHTPPGRGRGRSASRNQQSPHPDGDSLRRTERGSRPRQKFVRGPRQKAQEGASAEKGRTPAERTGAPAGEKTEEFHVAGLKQPVWDGAQPAETPMLSVRGRVLAAGAERKAAAQQTADSPALSIIQQGLWARTLSASARKNLWAAAFGLLRSENVRFSAEETGWRGLPRAVRGGIFSRPEAELTVRGPEPFVWSTPSYSADPPLLGAASGSPETQIFPSHPLQNTPFAPALLQPAARREARGVQRASVFGTLPDAGSPVLPKTRWSGPSAPSHAALLHRLMLGQSEHTEPFAAAAVRTQGFGIAEFRARQPQFQPVRRVSRITERPDDGAAGSAPQSAERSRMAHDEPAGSFVRNRLGRPALWSAPDAVFAQPAALPSAAERTLPQPTALTDGLTPAARSTADAAHPNERTTRSMRPFYTPAFPDFLQTVLRPGALPYGSALNAFSGRTEQGGAAQPVPVAGNILSPLLQRQVTEQPPQPTPAQSIFKASHGAAQPLPVAGNILSPLFQRQVTEQPPRPTPAQSIFRASRGAAQPTPVAENILFPLLQRQVTEQPPRPTPEQSIFRASHGAAQPAPVAGNILHPLLQRQVTEQPPQPTPEQIIFRANRGAAQPTPVAGSILHPLLRRQATEQPPQATPEQIIFRANRGAAQPTPVAGNILYPLLQRQATEQPPQATPAQSIFRASHGAAQPTAFVENILHPLLRRQVTEQSPRPTPEQSIFGASHGAAQPAPVTGNILHPLLQRQVTEQPPRPTPVQSIFRAGHGAAQPTPVTGNILFPLLQRQVTEQPPRPTPVQSIFRASRGAAQPTAFVENILFPLLQRQVTEQPPQPTPEQSIFRAGHGAAQPTAFVENILFPLLQRQVTEQPPQPTPEQSIFRAGHGAAQPTPFAENILHPLLRRQATEQSPRPTPAQSIFRASRGAALPVPVAGNILFPLLQRQVIEQPPRPTPAQPFTTAALHWMAATESPEGGGAQSIASLHRSAGAFRPARHAQQQGTKALRRAGLQSERLARVLLGRSAPAREEPEPANGGLTYFAQPLEAVQPLNAESTAELPAGAAEARIVYRDPAPPPAAVQQAAPEQSGEDVLRQQVAGPLPSPLDAAFSYQAPAASAAANTAPAGLTQEQEAQLAQRVLDEINYNRLTEELLVRVERRLRAERRKFGL